MRRRHVLAGVAVAALGCGEPATGAPEGCLELFDLPEPVFEEGVEPGPGAEVWCGETPMPSLGAWVERSQPGPDLCEVETLWFEAGRHVSTERESYTHDAAGHVVEAASDDVVMRTRFGATGQPVLRTWSTPGSDAQLQAWQTFDSDGRPRWLETFDGAYVSWVYDPDGRLVAWQQGDSMAEGGGRRHVELDPAGMPTLILSESALGDVRQRRTTFDAAAGVFRATGSGPEEGRDVAWRCDAAGRLVERRTTPPALADDETDAAAYGFTELWRYDTAGRLVWSWAGGAGAPQVERRAYAAQGDLLAVDTRLDGEPLRDTHSVTVRDAAGRIVCAEWAASALVPVGADGEPGPTPCIHARDLMTYDPDGASATVRTTCLNIVEPDTTRRIDVRNDAAGRVTEVRTAIDSVVQKIVRFHFDCPPVP